jgi:hypothetical protein
MQVFPDDLPSRAAKDVANKKYFHDFDVISYRPRREQAQPPKGLADQLRRAQEVIIA